MKYLFCQEFIVSTALSYNFDFPLENFSTYFLAFRFYNNNHNLKDLDS